MRLSDKRGVQLIVRFLEKNGIKNIVLSPGSRNAPLSLSFENHGGFSVRVLPDERVAAYHGLGISLYTKEPVVLVCTSGTAVLNYAPAIAEAYYQHVPLIVITADRPSEWIDQGDGQTIRQENVYANFIYDSFNCKGDASATDELAILKKGLIKILSSLHQNQGPVHLNVSLEEPLYKLTERIIPYEPALIEEKNDIVFQFSDEQKEIFGNSEKTLILAGQMPPDKNVNDRLIKLAERENIIVLTETNSNLHSEKFISCIDRTIDGFSEEEKNAFKPDLLITIGDAVVSRKIKAWLRNYKPTHHWKVGLYDLSMDTYKCKTENLISAAWEFINAATTLSENKTRYRDEWQEMNSKKRGLHKSFLKETEFCDLKVFDLIIDKIPSGNLVHLGNSSPVRYAQLFERRADIIYYSNRGVSGIDGCTSTAAGMADSSDKQVTLITGDISFFYDSNAFWNDYLKNLKIILINNGGGGIFRIIDQPENIEDTEKLFETRHDRNGKGIAAAFGIKYWTANDEKSLITGMNLLYQDNLPGILEIFTPTEKNPLILKNYFTHLKNN